MEKDMYWIPCNSFCAVTFDSSGNFCKQCESYEEGLKYYGKTKTSRDYQVEATVSSAIIVARQIKK